MATFDQLLSRLADDERRRGEQFERLCAWFLVNDPLYGRVIRRVQRWNEWVGRWGADAGIDLVAETHRGELWAIQAKAYSPAYSIRKADVDSFLSESARRGFAFRLLIATTRVIGATALRTIDAQEKPCGLLLLDDLRRSRVAWPSSPDEETKSQRPRRTPWPHQHDAVVRAVEHLRSEPRGLIQMACGTGKTLVALWIAEGMAAERTLVLVPSLSLVAQTLREWSDAAAESTRFLAVCSDESVSEDHFAMRRSQLAYPVTTNPAEIADWLREPARGVIISTYQSADRVGDALRRTRLHLDVLVADESHRLVGPLTGSFAAALADDGMPAAKRVFMTATPKILTGRWAQGARQDVQLASMDDATQFGTAFYRLSFGEAISRGLLSDYQVVVVGANDATFESYFETGRLMVDEHGRVIDARTVVSAIALMRAIAKYDLRRVLTFHGRVKRARDFADVLRRIDALLSPEHRGSRLWTGHVSGEMPSGQRDALLSHFTQLGPDDIGVISNARCLGEGVDLPAVDCVAFIDPRDSLVDIIQAVGRAIRKNPAKRVGTILVPVIIDPREDPTVAMADSQFEAVWNVLRALRAHDETLAESLDRLRYQMGRLGNRDFRLPRRVYVDMPAAITEDFVRAFDARLIEATTPTWEFWLGLVARFSDRVGHARVPQSHVEDGWRLGQWVNRQRTLRRRDGLTKSEVARLEAVPGWTWNWSESSWEDGFAALRLFVAQEGHAAPRMAYVSDTGYPLGQWVINQRQQHRLGRLAQSRAQRLEALAGWLWDADSDDADWQAGYDHLRQFVDSHGHGRVPSSYVSPDGYRLGQWVIVQRYWSRTGRLVPTRRELLETLEGWAWDPTEDAWERGYACLLRYVDQQRSADVPQRYVDDSGFKLGTWVNRQRRAYMKGELEADRAKRLAGISGWRWLTRSWEHSYGRLRAYVETNGTARVPQPYRDEGGFRLGGWVNQQRGRYKKGKLTSEQVEKLEQLPGWVWHVRDVGRSESGGLDLELQGDAIQVAAPAVTLTS